jgi:hypothetical protein
MRERGGRFSRTASMNASECRGSTSTISSGSQEGKEGGGKEEKGKRDGLVFVRGRGIPLN